MAFLFKEILLLGIINLVIKFFQKRLNFVDKNCLPANNNLNNFKGGTFLEPLEFLLGIATFGFVVRMKKPLRQAAVFTACQLISAADRLKATAYGLKEEIEDIVAEAQYENMRNNLGPPEDMGEKPDTDRNPD